MPKMHALITALILERPLCISCIESKTSLPSPELVVDLDRIAEALVLHRTHDRCRSCDTLTTVVSVDRPPI